MDIQIRYSDGEFHTPPLGMFFLAAAAYDYPEMFVGWENTPVQTILKSMLAGF